MATGPNGRPSPTLKHAVCKTGHTNNYVGYMYKNILDFCFNEVGSQQFFQKSLEFDRLLTERFSQVLKQTAAAEFYSWRSSARGRLAEIIILDQFSRNVYRDSPAAFAQ